MKEKLQDIFDYYELKMNWKFIEFEEKLEEIRVKQIKGNSILSISEKYNMLNNLE